MRAKGDTLNGLHFVLSHFPNILSSKSNPSLCKALIIPNLCFSSSALPIKTLAEGRGEEASKDAIDVFRRCGCSDAEISKIFLRQPSLVNAKGHILQSKIDTLKRLGLIGSDLVKTITCRPRFLACRFVQGLEKRIDFLESFFNSKQMLLKVVIRNPSLLNYDINVRIKPRIALYEEMGIGIEDLGPLILSRPTILTRSSLDKEKLEYIRMTHVPKESKMYKYVVSLIAISRVETIREKVANYEKFGFSVAQVMDLFGRSPNVLTLSIDKVQRNMTYIIGTMKLPSSIVLYYPYLLYQNLEVVLKPRYLLTRKIQEMGLMLEISRPTLITALRMKERRFLKVFVTCHEKAVAKGLMEFYTKFLQLLGHFTIGYWKTMMSLTLIS